MHLSQPTLCTTKMELALEVKLCLDFYWVTRPWRRTLTNGSACRALLGSVVLTQFCRRFWPYRAARLTPFCRRFWPCRAARGWVTSTSPACTWRRCPMRLWSTRRASRLNSARRASWQSRPTRSGRIGSSRHFSRIVKRRTTANHPAVALAFEEMRILYASGQEISVQKFGNAYQRNGEMNGAFQKHLYHHHTF